MNKHYNDPETPSRDKLANFVSTARPSLRTLLVSVNRLQKNGASEGRTFPKLTLYGKVRVSCGLTIKDLGDYRAADSNTVFGKVVGLRALRFAPKADMISWDR